MESFKSALEKHIRSMSPQQRQKMRDTVRKARPKNAADKAGQLAFLYMLDEIDKQKNESPKP